MEIARRTTNSFGESMRIFSQRMTGGVVSKLESSSAEALLASTAATVPDLERQIAIQENLICVLAGRTPGPIERRKGLLQEMPPPEVPAGLPSALLERRPDIREADQFFRSANAQVGVAKADFFPKVSLSALYGQVSPELSALTSGGANAWAVAANVTGPLFEGGKQTYEYRRTKEAREEARLHYQATVLYAFAEVSDALVSREKLAQERTQQARAVDAYRTAVEVATERYRVGQSSYYEVLQEQQLLFPAENALTQIELNQLLAVVQLYQALGGGWENEAAEKQKAH
jgi:multidrug efflux system outer membrane protein